LGASAQDQMLSRAMDKIIFFMIKMV